MEVEGGTAVERDDVVEEEESKLILCERRRPSSERLTVRPNPLSMFIESIFIFMFIESICIESMFIGRWTPPCIPILRPTPRFNSRSGGGRARDISGVWKMPLVEECLVVLSREPVPTERVVGVNSEGPRRDSPVLVTSDSPQREVLPLAEVAVFTETVEEREKERMSELVLVRVEPERMGSDPSAGEADTTERSWKVNGVEPR